jgi:hypothetical protein
MKPAVLADPLVGPLTAVKALPTELFVAAAVVAAVDEIAAEVAAALELELVEVRVVGSAVVVAVAVLAAGGGCCYSSLIVRHCWLAAGHLIESENH